MEAGIPPRPEETKLVFNKGPCSIYVERPPPGCTDRGLLHIVLIAVGFCISTALFLALFIISFQTGLHRYVAPMNLCGIVALLLCMLLCIRISQPYTREVLHIGRQDYGIWTQFACRSSSLSESHQVNPKAQRVLGSSCNLTSAQLIPAKGPDAVVGPTSGTKSPGYLVIQDGMRRMKFGIGLSMAELEWLHSEIADTIENVNNLGGSQAEEGIAVVKLRSSQPQTGILELPTTRDKFEQFLNW